jgi:hypothetical protein
MLRRTTGRCIIHTLQSEGGDFPLPVKPNGVFWLRRWVHYGKRLKLGSRFRNSVELLHVTRDADVPGATPPST